MKHLGLLIVGLICILAVALAATPIGLSYVYSDSMEPTIGQSDGYILLPAGDVNHGNIVTFWSENRNSYVTHRVVGRTSDGFLTKGDNNRVTDQAAGATHVQRDDIVGRVLTVGGEPVIVPQLGHAIRFVHAHRVPIVGLLGIIFVGGSLRGRSTTRPSRSVPRVREILWPIFLIALVSAVGLQFLGGTTEQLTYVATTSETSAPNAITVGEPKTGAVRVDRSPLPLTVGVISADGMTITNRTGNASTTTVSVRIPPPTQTGVVRTKLRVHRYVAVLPPATVRRLHGVHPLLAALATTVIALCPLALVSALAIDGGQPIRTVESRSQRKLSRRWWWP